MSTPKWTAKLNLPRLFMLYLFPTPPPGAIFMFSFSEFWGDLVFSLALLFGLNYYFNRAVDIAATKLACESVSMFSLIFWAVFWPITHFWVSEKN